VCVGQLIHAGEELAGVVSASASILRALRSHRPGRRVVVRPAAMGDNVCHIDALCRRLTSAIAGPNRPVARSRRAWRRMIGFHYPHCDASSIAQSLVAPPSKQPYA
jgi:hypothetical protein